MRQQTEVGVRRVTCCFFLRTLLTPKSQHSMNSFALSCCLIYLANTTIGITCKLSCYVKICWITLSLTASPDILLVLHREGYNCSQTKKTCSGEARCWPCRVSCSSDHASEGPRWQQWKSTTSHPHFARNLFLFCNETELCIRIFCLRNYRFPF